MCGIIGIAGARPAAPILIEGLKRLEYRGYDSAGIATLINGSIGLRRASGKIANLIDLLQRKPLRGKLGIGHTRWATHGPPNEVNAHPQVNERVAVVHNGIIENHLELRAELEERGYTFESDTDTEVIAHLVSDQLACQLSPQDAVSAALKRLEGAFALAIIFAGRHDLMIAARRGSPLALGFGEGEGYLGSDALALSHLTDRICYLDEGDWAEVTPFGSRIYDARDRPVERSVRSTSVSSAMASKDGYRHFMQKEIFEQPSGVGATLESLLDRPQCTATLPALPFDLAAVSRFTFSACGTAFYAAAVGKYWFEQLARQPVEIDIASEFRYREAPLPDAGVSLFVSQSGETIDTLAALRFAKSQGQPVLSVVNVPESAIARESDVVLQTLAGPEISVASTKAFTTQLVVLASLALATAEARQTLDEDRLSSLTKAMISLPAYIDRVLKLDVKIRDVAASLVTVRDVLYLGRGALFPIAMEDRPILNRGRAFPD